jgi:uncharacterized repeat protein (TIGR01451 family)
LSAPAPDPVGQRWRVAFQRRGHESLATTPSAPAEALVYRARASATYYARVTFSTGTPRDYLLSISRNCRVGPPTDLAVPQIDAPDPVAPGGNVTYTVSVNNAGPQPSTLVTLRDDLPADAGFVSAIPSQGACSGTGPVVCHLGTIAGGGGATVRSRFRRRRHRMIATCRRFSGHRPAASRTWDRQRGKPDADSDGVPDATTAPRTTGPPDDSGRPPPCWPGRRIGPDAVEPPAAPGGTVVTDVLRTAMKSDFTAAACVGTDLTTTTMSDPAMPAPAFYYLVRAGNVCGSSTLGTRSDGTPIVGPTCP